MAKTATRPTFAKTVRRANLRNLDEALDAVCAEWDRLAEGDAGGPHGLSAAIEWDQKMGSAMSALRAAQATLASLNRTRVAQRTLH